MNYIYNDKLDFQFSLSLLIDCEEVQTDYSVSPYEASSWITCNKESLRSLFNIISKDYAEQIAQGGYCDVYLNVTDGEDDIQKDLYKQSTFLGTIIEE